MAKNENRCWPGYEPVPGKEQHEQGSCRKKAPSKSSPGEKAFQAKRSTSGHPKTARKKATKRASVKKRKPQS